jgi:hypothetical protein
MAVRTGGINRESPTRTPRVPQSDTASPSLGHTELHHRVAGSWWYPSVLLGTVGAVIGVFPSVCWLLLFPLRDRTTVVDHG